MNGDFLEKTLIIIPAFNEEKNLGRVISGLFEHGYNNILVVDDGSRDLTAEIARRGGVIVLRHAFNRGQGAALESGNEFARQNGFEIAVHFDADGQFNPEDIKGALKKITDGETEVVLGSRFLDNRSKIPFFKKYFILPLARLVNYIFTGVWLSDAHNGFRILGPRALKEIKIVQDGMAHATEIIVQIKKHDLKFKEYPVEVKYYKFGQNFGAGFKIIKDLIMGKII